MKAWHSVARALDTKPMVSVTIAGDVPMRAERYIFQTQRRQIPPLPTLVMACHLAGGRASEGQRGGHPVDFIPSLSAVLPAQRPTEWAFGGAIDVAIFYLLDDSTALASRLHCLSDAAEHLIPFSDPLVSACAQQIVEQRGREPQAEREFIERLCAIMIEQTCRVLDGSSGTHLPASPRQMGRLEAALAWITQNLAGTLSIEELARHSGVSASHFRRLFAEATGTTPHHYILQQRLERTRELLTRTDVSIARIAAECGFHSQSHMTTAFRAAYGMTPAHLRRQGKVFAEG